MYRELVAVELLDEPVSVPLECVQGALALVRDALESDSPYPGLSGYRAPTLHEGTSGRPRLTFPGTCWHAYLEIRFTVPQIANILCVSVHTLRRRMSKYVLSVRALYLALTDDQLDNILGEIQAQFPTCGNRQMQGHLLARGIRVQQRRIRESQRCVEKTENHQSSLLLGEWPIKAKKPSHGSHSVSVNCNETSANYSDTFAYFRITNNTFGAHLNPLEQFVFHPHRWLSRSLFCAAFWHTNLEVAKLTQLHVVTSEVQRLICTGSLRMRTTACAQLHAAESGT